MEGVIIDIQGLGVEDITLVMIKKKESRISWHAVRHERVQRGFLLASPRTRLYSYFTPVGRSHTSIGELPWKSIRKGVHLFPEGESL